MKQPKAKEKNRTVTTINGCYEGTNDKSLTRWTVDEL